jgi:hypothetical protein
MFHNVLADLDAHIGPNTRGETVVESRPNSSISNLIGICLHISEPADDARSHGARHCDFRYAHRSPEVVMVFCVQHGDDGIIDTNRYKCHETRSINDAHLLCSHKLAYKRMLGRRQTHEPEVGSLSLLGSPLGALLFAIILDFVVVSCPLLTISAKWVDPAGIVRGWLWRTPSCSAIVIAVGT